MSRATGVGPVTDEVCRQYIRHMEALICGGMLTTEHGGDGRDIGMMAARLHDQHAAFKTNKNTRKTKGNAQGEVLSCS